MIFKSEKLPYFYVLILGIIGLQGNYLIKNYLDSPIIEYKIEVTELSDKPEQTNYHILCSFANISGKTNFDSISFSLSYGSEQAQLTKFSNINLTTVHPSSLSEPLYFMNTDSSLITIKLTNFQPEFKYLLNFDCYNRGTANKEPYLYLTSTKEVKLQQIGLVTWLIKNQVPINMGILLILILVTILYSINLNKESLALRY